MNGQRWQDRLLPLIGLYVFLSPVIIPHFYAASVAAGAVAWSHYLVGAAIGLLGIAALSSNQLWEEWVTLVLGAWLIVSPWLLGFAGMRALTCNAVLTGAIVVILSASVLLASSRSVRPT
ncbi:SPW repeat protein [Pseudaminobacter sp. 19-2017]|uniref:SPW repeat protein n=1 Tax=Pseudaminobacter soli (ex Zhang et al. 2022) TaxID=2831468 RepID=A0A942DVT8_9HYPH|nr:SPW repeat protein [Pseudaminobacter soli]MBS3647332.1 SPW repeat protein [Pseudaminobacter soli]